MLSRAVFRLSAALLACAAPLIALPSPAAAQSAARTTDWTRTVTLGANGAYVLGNPNAPTKLVEYFSYTCSHCAAFQTEGAEALKAQWVRQGRVSLEYRNYVRDAFDLTAALLARCGGATHFVGNHDALYANFGPWLTRAKAYAEAQGDTPPPTDRTQQFVAIAEGTGLFTLFAARGLTPAVQRQCLADKKALSDVLALTATSANQDGFSGTPFFVMNGKSLKNAHSWEALRPALPQSSK